MKSQFLSAITPSAPLNEPALWFIFQGNKLLVYNGEGQASIPVIRTPTELSLSLLRQEYLGCLTSDNDKYHCYSGEIGADVQPPGGMSFNNLRALYPLLKEDHFWVAGRAVQIVDWDRNHQFCGQCGHKTEDEKHERAKKCPQCGLVSYPRISPAIIVRITRQSARGPEILLARAQRFPAGMFSVLAGFVEPGETLEGCVEREIFEEVSLKVKNICYFGSQPWPFPNSLMIAFTAELDSGQIITDSTELVEANWFAPDDMPAIPPPPSIANRLITSWLKDNWVQQ